MFGIKFIKVQPTTYLLQYRGGKVVREGLGLSFFHYAPTTSLVAVPVGSADVPFIFQETTADFQTVTIQGQVTYRVGDPKRLATLLNYTLVPNGQTYAAEDPKKLPERVIHVVNVLARGELQKLQLRAAVRASDELVNAVKTRLTAAEEITSLGLEVLGLSILAIKPTPETVRALEAETREKMFREADEAIYARRNSAVEQERAIKENELNTEIAVENKKRQIRETQMDAHRAAEIPADSVFASLAEASEFFARGAMGYSATTKLNCCDGLELHTSEWQVEPLEIQSVSSSFFDDPSRFPNGTIQFDCALLMQNIEHEWRVLPRLER